jgi:uncharacterized protein (TIGR00304 family)
MSGQLLFNLGVVLVFAGFIIAFIAVIFMFLTTMKGKGKVKGGGAVIIGPFPIVFGTDKESIKMLLLFSMALIILILVTTIIFHYTLK